MGLFADKDVRMVGLGLVISPVMFMAYEVFQNVFQLHFNNQVLLNVDLLQIANKMSAVVPTMLIGIGLLIYFERTHKEKDEKKADCMMEKDYKWVWALVASVVLIIIGIVEVLAWGKPEPLYFIGGGVITITILTITSYATKKAKCEMKKEFEQLNANINEVLNKLKDNSTKKEEKEVK